LKGEDSKQTMDRLESQLKDSTTQLEKSKSQVLEQSLLIEKLNNELSNLRIEPGPMSSAPMATSVKVGLNGFRVLIQIEI
jgi:hypothetical protein